MPCMGGTSDVALYFALERIESRGGPVVGHASEVIVLGNTLRRVLWSVRQ